MRKIVSLAAVLTIITVFMSPACTMAERTAPPEVLGLTSIGSACFPAVVGTAELPLLNGDFEKLTGGWPVGWSVPDGVQMARAVADLTMQLQRVPKPSELARAMGITGGELAYMYRKMPQMASPWQEPTAPVQPVAAVVGGRGGEKAPQGRAYLHIPAGNMSVVRSPELQVESNRPYLFSMWVRSTAPAKGYFWGDVGLDAISIAALDLPDTGGKWKRVGLYFRAPLTVTKGRWITDPGAKEGTWLDIDDVRLRSATEDEFSAAYQAWRKTLPANGDLSPRPNDGRELALTIAKLQGKKGIPGKPLMVRALGSSFTGYLGDGEDWRQVIRRRFPNAPEFVYQRRTGSGTPYEYVLGWVKQFVADEQPDIIFTNTNGDTAKLDEMLTEIRKRCTADIIVPSLHFMASQQADLADSELSAAQREVCRKHGAVFVENRREIAEWMIAHNFKAPDLLVDAVHQNTLARVLLNENIMRHFQENPSPIYNPDERERRYNAAAALKGGQWQFSGKWTEKAGNILSSEKGARLKMTFQGNRIDVIGLRSTAGGSVKVLVDGQPADKLPVFLTSEIKAAPNNAPYGWHSGSGSDQSPHAVSVGGKVVPQQWTIRMTDDIGNFELVGSKTGADGTGNNQQPFSSKSGQVSIDPTLWRNSLDRNKVFTNRTGDYWTFEVKPTNTASVSFKGTSAQPELFSLPAARCLKNGPHTLEIVLEGDGEVILDSLYVYEPPLK